MKSAQELVHWLEIGPGARWLRVGAAIAAAVALSFLVVLAQFHGPKTEATLEEADVGRQLAAGHGFSTFINYPQTASLLEKRGQHFDPRFLYPELHRPPLYSSLIAGGLRLIPAAQREALFALSPQVTDGYGADYFLLAINLGLFWLAAWLTYEVGRQLFEPRVGWLAALALLVTLPFWQETLALNGTPLLMVLALTAFLVWRRIEVLAGERMPSGGAPDERLVGDGTVLQSHRGAWGIYGWTTGLGVLCALLFLTEYSAGALILTAVAYAAGRFRGRGRWIVVATVLGGFAVVAGPWAARNISLTGHPVALAAQNVALKAGDPAADPALVRAAFSPQGPAINLNKLGNKTLTALQENLKGRVWSGGAMWFAAFFIAGWLYTFRSVVANRIRWVFTASFAVLLLAQSSLNSGESDRLVVICLAPLIIVFGAGFFFVLLGSNAVLSRWPRGIAAALLILQSLPLLHDALAPTPAVRFQYPPYFPALLRGMRTELEVRNASGRYGAMADIPAGVAWYGGVRVWAQPARMRDFYAVTTAQPIGELLLTPRTLDRPFFTELNAHAIVPGSLSAVQNRFGEWGEIYAGLVTGTLPREFPLKVPQKIAENLYVLFNPALPPPRGK